MSLQSALIPSEREWENTVNLEQQGGCDYKEPPFIASAQQEAGFELSLCVTRDR